ncbi:MAG: HK97 family phage prohead protease [Proteobacteria bacterium]|nr:HK97 family phage prohead protease [Pseudomonadota bacterium]
MSGYCVRFGDITTIGGLFRERIAVGAFDRTLRENEDVLGLWGHDWNRVLSRTTSGTLQLRADRIGLFFTMDAPEDMSPEWQTVWSAVQREDVRQCSFSFSVRRQTWEDGDDDQLPLRTLEDVDLFEVSIVSAPAYPTTSASTSDRKANSRNAQRRIAHKMTLRERQVANAQMAMKARGIL